MSRWLLIASVIASVLSSLVLTACSSDDRDEQPPRAHPSPECSKNTTCGSCTPILGCGWCQLGEGAGKCASSPSACGSSFRWNWEPADCPALIEADAAVAETSSDAAEETSSDAAEETSSDAAEETSSDAAEETETTASCNAPAGVGPSCARTTGGSLCAATQYSVGCHASGAKPETSLGCTLATTSGSSTYYCCPCR